jgi:hypothetical protein
MGDETVDVGQAVNALVDEYRAQCCGFFVPITIRTPTKPR